MTTLTSQNGSSGTSTSSLQSFTTSKASSTEQSSSVSVSAADQDIKLALMVNNDPTSGSVQDVDENYDDCWYNENLILHHKKKTFPRNINSNN